MAGDAAAAAATVADAGGTVTRVLPTPSKTQFHERGWAVIENVFPSGQVQELAELTGELAAAQLDEAVGRLADAEGLTVVEGRKLLGAAASGDPTALATVQGLVGANANASGKDQASPQAFDPDFAPDDPTRLAPRKLENPYGLDRRYRAIVHDANLHQLAWELLGGEQPPLLYGSQLFMKPPEIGSVKPYHQGEWQQQRCTCVRAGQGFSSLNANAAQTEATARTPCFAADNFYFRVAADADVLTLWIALDDADRGNGCMHFIQTPIEQAKIVPHTQDPTRATYLIAETTPEDRAAQGYGEVRAGGVVAWSGATIHGSNANSTGRWRRAFAVHFVRAGFSMQPGVPEKDLSELNEAHAAVVSGRMARL